MADRIDAGTVFVAFLFQNAERPLVSRTNGECCRAVAQDRHAANVLEQPARPPYIGAECLGILNVRPGVVVAVTGKLMTRGNNPMDHRVVPLGNPPKREEGGTYPHVGELLQNAVDIGLDPRGDAVPGSSVDAVGECLDLEMLLDIHSHRIARRVRHRSATALSNSSTRRN